MDKPGHLHQLAYGCECALWRTTCPQTENPPRRQQAMPRQHYDEMISRPSAESFQPCSSLGRGPGGQASPTALRQHKDVPSLRIIANSTLVQVALLSDP